MNCKFCNAEMKDGELICPDCGKENTEHTETVSTQMPEFSAEEIGEGMPFVQELDGENENRESKPKRKLWQIILAVACCAALMVALVVLVLQGMGIDLSPRENNVFYKNSYTVSDKTAVRNADKVVAAIGDAELTNAQLQILYWMQVDEFLRYNGTSYFDYTKPLDEQIAYEASGQTWQQVFIERSIKAWRRYQLMNMLAEEGDYALIDKYQDSLEKIPADLEEMAKENGFESADAMIREDMGAACTAADYIDYVTLYNIAMLFLNEKYEELAPTMEEMENYYTDNEAAFKSSGITKDSGSLVDVRHILIQLAEPAAGSNGKVDYTEDQWEQCRQDAQALLDQWKAGAADEESFAELANKHSKDGGSNTNGGLYTQVEKGYMVDAFDEWIFDETRVPGDTGLVKTEFGYHIMYFVDAEEKWITAARTNLLSDRIEAMVAAAGEKWPVEINYKNIALTEIER